MVRPVDHSQALILSGGGAYGAYEVGVMTALLTGESPATGYAPLNPGIFTGTSVGAVNAALMVAFPGADICDVVRRLAGVWLDEIADSDRRCGNGVYRFRGNLLRYADLDCLAANPALPFNELTQDGAFFAQDLFRRGVNFLISGGGLAERSLQFVDVSAFVDSDPLGQLLARTIPLEGIRRSDRALRVVATNWDTGEVKTFANADMTEEFGYAVLRGSAAIPGIFPPSYVAGDPYVDGGLVMNTPLKCAIQAGGTTLHVIYMDPDVRNMPLTRLQNTIDTLDRVFVINLATKINEDIDTAAWINEGMEAVERAGAGWEMSGAEARAFVRAAGQIERRMRAGGGYRKLTIHRYHPHDDLGGGILGLLNFERGRMTGLIERGFADALNHDCAESHCILPARGPGRQF